MARRERVLIMTLPEKGHINPVIGLARHLENMGVELSLYTPADIAPQLAAAGLTLAYHRPLTTEFQWPKEHASSGQDFALRSQDQAWLRRWLRRLLLETTPAQIAPLRALIRQERPDLVVTDPMYYAAIIAAQAEQVPWAGVSSSLNPVTPEDWRCPMVDTLDALSEERRALFQSQGECPEFRVCDAISPWLNIVFTTEHYVSRALSANTCSFFVGPALPAGPRGDELAFPWERLDSSRPLVYMSLGSQNFYHPLLFACVAQALANSDVQLVLAVNDLLDTEFAAALPKHVIAVRYAPQLALLDRASLVVSHGGANSVMESLQRGLPIMMLPLLNDQHLQARLLTQSGAGIALDPRDLRVESCRASLLTLLDAQSPQRQRAQAIGRSYAAHDGSLASARLIAQLARHKQPLLPQVRERQLQSQGA